MHVVICTWTPRRARHVSLHLLSERGRPDADRRPARDIPDDDFASVLGPDALARVKLAGSLSLTLFDDEWRALLAGVRP